MEAWLLREWQRQSPWQILLRPMSWIFAVLVGVRSGLYRAGLLKNARITVPVIVVGNISVGGTGKTPVVLAIAQILARSGHRCGLISRGYSRRVAADVRHAHAANVIEVVADNAGSALISDEAQLLARRSGAPVYISADRANAAQSLLRDHPDVDVLVCDDGLQHYALRRDIEICVIDATRGFGNGAMLPAGPLREPTTRLARVDAIIVNGIAALEQFSLDDLAPDVPAFQMKLGSEWLVHVRDGTVISIEQGLAEFSTKRILACAGTGNPARFFSHLGDLGFNAVETRAFGDHHPFVESDFARQNAEIIVMTEKDAVKCGAFADDRMWFMRVDAILPEAFAEFVIKRLSELKK
ncbi:MAG: tetraacyldisaccharide 4'-kinase [Betaproteobacteria bacterium]|nr:tetraacyldisaccharide 4'-kinase [Betaproteobacteria bacterium]